MLWPSEQELVLSGTSFCLNALLSLCRHCFHARSPLVCKYGGIFPGAEKKGNLQ